MPQCHGEPGAIEPTEGRGESVEWAEWSGEGVTVHSTTTLFLNGASVAVPTSLRPLSDKLSRWTSHLLSTNILIMLICASHDRPTDRPTDDRPTHRPTDRPTKHTQQSLLFTAPPLAVAVACRRILSSPASHPPPSVRSAMPYTGGYFICSAR